MYQKDTEVTFTVTGRADGTGVVRIGCKSFSEAEISDVAKDLIIKEPNQFQVGDVIKVISRNGGYADNSVYIRGHKDWSRVEGGYGTDDAWVKRALAGDNPDFRAEFLAKAGKAV